MFVVFLLLLVLPPLVFSSPSCNTNLIFNGDAEEAPPITNIKRTIITPPGWTTTSSFTVVSYNTHPISLCLNPVPPNKGQNFFAGGPGTSFSTASQEIQVSSLVETIDYSGTPAYFTFSGYFGGLEEKSDFAEATVSFRNSSGGLLLRTSALRKTKEDRQGITSLLASGTMGTVPYGTRSVTVDLVINGTDGSYNDGYVDNLSLIFFCNVIPINFCDLDNVIINPGAESPKRVDMADSTLPPTNWTNTESLTVLEYDTPGYFTTTDSGPPDRGLNFFGGGEGGAVSTASQDLDLTSLTPVLSLGTVFYNLSAYLGGYADQDDNAQLQVFFKNSLGTVLKTVTIGPVLAAQRGEVTSLIFVSQSGQVPVGSTTANILLTMTREGGTSNDGYADNLGLRFTCS